MSGFRETGIIGKKTQVVVPEDPEAAPVTDYGNYLAIIEETEEEFNRCQDEFFKIPVTDERSAGFYALGMSQALKSPVAVCVTSGSALLNLAPAVAEAYYQHAPLVVISADRPPQWIDQLDGQTLPQPDALGRFVRKAVSLPEPRDEEERWFCNRLLRRCIPISRRR